MIKISQWARANLDSYCKILFCSRAGRSTTEKNYLWKAGARPPPLNSNSPGITVEMMLYIFYTQREPIVVSKYCSRRSYRDKKDKPQWFWTHLISSGDARATGARGVRASGKRGNLWPLSLACLFLRQSPRRHLTIIRLLTIRVLAVGYCTRRAVHRVGDLNFNSVGWGGGIWTCSVKFTASFLSGWIHVIPDPSGWM